MKLTDRKGVTVLQVNPSLKNAFIPDSFKPKIVGHTARMDFTETFIRQTQNISINNKKKDKMTATLL